MSLIVYYSKRPTCAGSAVIRDMVSNGTIRDSTMVCIEELQAESQQAGISLPKWLNGVPLCVEILHGGDKVIYRASDAIHFLRMPAPASTTHERKVGSGNMSRVAASTMGNALATSQHRYMQTSGQRPVEQGEMSGSNRRTGMEAAQGGMGDEWRARPVQWEEDEEREGEASAASSAKEDIWGIVERDEEETQGDEPPKITEQDVQAELKRREAEMRMGSGQA